MPANFTVMTYNVHSSIGMDRKISPRRIARIISRFRPDVVALQELDMGLRRTKMIDQAHFIAERLCMEYHFQSCMQVEDGGYGNAILSSLPMRLVKGGALPLHPHYNNKEPRGAVWVEVQAGGEPVQVVATHFGLNWQERIFQAETILGPEWLGHSECRTPVVLCGDLNAMPRSAAYRRLARSLHDVQRVVKGKRPQPTWPVLFPFLRIDHMFVSSDLAVEDVLVPRTPLTTVASDHLPMIVTISLRQQVTE
ncbi:endonuclease/exonuclease/phosphatase family protein [Geobacter sp. DSM 9736]|uniref:endonuclease/exonuclease/phosphatase family protein n=1 Tax=Geobacter sp. DSM 9736 TaxID=1277350 RepID=UPI000B50DE3A|nr:endonuclease/exonuclease/phosphatase family protein [Geobacter sp. DSM 9736]SNB46306.1 Metal-dependent hydrolase, endonuclease/exonuclease/phosphatase family [Geobacter sp. DSM 9736]